MILQYCYKSVGLCRAAVLRCGEDPHTCCDISVGMKDGVDVIEMVEL